MAPPPRFRIIILVLSLIFISTALADTPSDNDIPTLAMRILGSNLFTEDITIDLLCELSWLNFDAVNFGGKASKEEFGDLMSLCDNAGVYYSICPAEIMQYLQAWGDPAYRYWFRNSDSLFTSDHCFARCDADFDSIVQYLSAESLYYEHDSISIRATIVNDLSISTYGHDFLWFYEVYDEAPSQQWRHAARDTLPWNDYLPNVYTQARDSTGDTLTLAEVEASGIFSIQKYYAENDTLNPVTFTLNFGLLHSIDTTDYTGLNGNRIHGTMADQAISVRAVMEAEYQPPSEVDSTRELPDNSPEFIMFDYYPFRYVDIDHASTTTMCDDDWLFLIDHFEEGIDSTVIPAHEYDVPVYFFPQTFGKSGGSIMHDSAGSLNYQSYFQRKPAAREFRMLCNLALLHQAKGIFPYNLTSYLEPYIPEQAPNCIMSSLLDLHNIPFDAPYEEWVYTGRWPDSTLEYVRPDSLPPWRDGYDPLYNVSNPPDTTGSGQKRYEIWYKWLFKPYSDLYNNIGGILADVKRIGPEMYDLWWCSDTLSDGADIAYNTSTLPPGDLITPVIKVFEDEGQESCYLFYVDRYCISNDNPYKITFNPGDLPEHADCTTRLLDHSRRFIMDGTFDANDTIYTFLDTLDAGEGRLVELIDLSGGLPADVRITSSNVRMYQPTDFPHMETTVGDSVNIFADYYNMGTQSRNNVIVTLYDSTTGSLTGTDYIDFDGLPFLLPGSCRSCDRSTASFGWRPDSTDIGVHRFTVAAATWYGEPDPDDNSVDFAFMVNPRDYATEVRGDSWDMGFDSTSAWHTCDIEAVAGNWNTVAGWTDSVSGMFEGVIEYDSSLSKFRGVISLTIPEDSTKYIDTDRFHILSMGVTIDNPFVQESSSACSVLLRWWDSNGEPGCDWYGVLSTHSYNVSNGWDGWSEIGPIDLNDIAPLRWGGNDVSELRLMFQAGEPVILPEDSLFSVRIGWIRLEEDAAP